MALGKKLFQWNYTDIVKGMSSSDGISDGGFSPNTDAVNIITQSGLIYQPSVPTDASTNLAGQMIASCEDPSGNYARLYVAAVTSSQDGNFYSLSTGNVLTARGSSDTSHDYIQGKTDMIAYAGEAYITNASTLVRWSSIGSSNTFDTGFASFSSALAPHPALVYNNFAYYGDGNLLLRQDGAGVSPVTILTLAPGVVIVALGIDPGSGLILISLIGQINLSDTINSGASVAFYDGFSAEVSRYVQVDGMITAFPSTEGAMYAAYGQNLGLWNGSGITFLRKMNVDFDNTQLMYKHHFTSIDSTLYVIEKYKVIAYGPVRQKGPNVFYSALANTPSGTPTNLTNIANIGQNQVSISYFTSKFAIWATQDIVNNPGTMTLYTNSYDFDDEVWIRRIRVIFATSVGTNVTPGTLVIFNENGQIAVGGNGSGGYSLVNSSGASVAYKDLLNVNQRVKMAQIRLGLDTGNFGIRRIIVYGELANITE